MAPPAAGHGFVGYGYNAPQINPYLPVHPQQQPFASHQPLRMHHNQPWQQGRHMTQRHMSMQQQHQPNRMGMQQQMGQSNQRWQQNMGQPSQQWQHQSTGQAPEQAVYTPPEASLPTGAAANSQQQHQQPQQLTK